MSSNTISKTASAHRQQIKDMLMICFGIAMYAFGYTAFILPERVVMGGVSGISALLFYAFEISPGISIWVLNITMLVLASKALSRQFAIRTIFGVTVMSALVGALQPFFVGHPIITAGKDTFMHVLIGAALGGGGLGLVFSHNGSTGGTDIIIALLNKYFNLSFGRAMQFIDCTIISSSYLLFHSMETIVYGVAFTLIASFACDYVINGSRQTVQIIIISKEFNKIADMINTQIDRGVTVIQGRGWYSKKDVEMLIVMARKHEAGDIMSNVKLIDPHAMVSQTFCKGIFGEGFDKIK